MSLFAENVFISANFIENKANRRKICCPGKREAGQFIIPLYISTSDGLAGVWRVGACGGVCGVRGAPCDGAFRASRRGRKVRCGCAPRGAVLVSGIRRVGAGLRSGVCLRVLPDGGVGSGGVRRCGVGGGKDCTGYSIKAHMTDLTKCGSRGRGCPSGQGLSVSGAKSGYPVILFVALGHISQSLFLISRY